MAKITYLQKQKALQQIRARYIGQISQRLIVAGLTGSKTQELDEHAAKEPKNFAEWFAQFLYTNNLEKGIE